MNNKDIINFQNHPHNTNNHIDNNNKFAKTADYANPSIHYNNYNNNNI